MAYNLQVRLGWNKGKQDYDYITLDISMSSMYTPALQDKSSVCAYQRAVDSRNGLSKGQKSKFSLKDIDLFTSQFDNENKLKEHLLMFGILPRQYAKNSLVIKFNAKNKPTKNYSIIYSGGGKYLDPTVIKDLLNERLLAEDYMFLAHVGSKLKNCHDCAETASIIYNLANYSDSIQRSKGFSRSYEAGLTIINFLVYTMSYKKKNGFFTTDIDWRKLHMLASVIIEILDSEEREHAIKNGEYKQKGSPTRMRTRPVKPIVKDEGVEDDDGQISIMGWYYKNNKET